MAKSEFPRIIPLLFSIILYTSSFFLPTIFNIKLQNLNNITDINYIEITTNLTFSNIVINNTITVLILAIGGFFMGTPTIINLTWNGYFIGVLVRAIVNIGFDKIIFLILPHGIFEIPAIIIAGAAGFKIPYEVIRYLAGKKEQILTKEDIKEYFTLALISLILIVIAAWIEANITLRIAETMLNSTKGI